MDGSLSDVMWNWIRDSEDHLPSLVLFAPLRVLPRLELLYSCSFCKPELTGSFPQTVPSLYFTLQLHPSVNSGVSRFEVKLKVLKEPQDTFAVVFSPSLFRKV